MKNTSEENPCMLNIQGIRLSVQLGVSEEERSHPQEVQIDIVLSFSFPLKGCQTDNIADTLCYHTMVNIVSETVGSKSFQLVEHLAATIYTALVRSWRNLRHNLPLCKVTVTKLHPPIAQLQRGVSFTYSGPSIEDI